MAGCGAGSPTSRGEQWHSHLLGPGTPAYAEVTQLLRSSARAGPAGAAVPLCQVILVALVLRVEIIWLCFEKRLRSRQNCLTHGEVRRRITHQQARRTTPSSAVPQDSSLWQSGQLLHS